MFVSLIPTGKHLSVANAMRFDSTVMQLGLPRGMPVRSAPGAYGNRLKWLAGNRS